MRILVFHGYLLRGTGSNVYNASLAAALTKLGHEVHLLCQDRTPAELDFVDAVGDWDGGALAVRELRQPLRCTIYRPDIGGLLPVYVADRYEQVEARPFPEIDDAELDEYVRRNVDAVRDVAARVRPDVALANHLVMGPLILSRALAGTDIPYAVKIHGSALEYTVKPHPRFLPHAREGIAGARAVLVGSRHTAESLWSALEDPSLPPRTRLGPPGVDVDAFVPREAGAARAGLQKLIERLAGEGGAEGGDSAFARDPAAAAEALRQVADGNDPIVAFVGKLLVAKGVDLLLAAWPLVLAREPRARLAIVGFGAYTEGARRLVACLASGGLDGARALVAEGRAAEGGERGELRYLAAFLAALEDDREARDRYVAAATSLPERVAFTGRLEHDELVDLLPACEALVVPSTFPEAFGMVAAEAAACGALPISADHSGLAEVSRVLARALPPEARDWLSFPLGPDAVPDLAERVCAWLESPPAVRETARAALVQTAGERYSWEGVARGVIAAAEGRLDELDAP